MGQCDKRTLTESRTFNSDWVTGPRPDNSRFTLLSELIRSLAMKQLAVILISLIFIGLAFGKPSWRWVEDGPADRPTGERAMDYIRDVMNEKRACSTQGCSCSQDYECGSGLSCKAMMCDL